MAKFLVIAEKPSVAQSLAKIYLLIRERTGIWRGTVASSVGAWGIWQSMSHRKSMMKICKMAV